MDLKRTWRIGFLTLLVLVCTSFVPAYANGVNLITNGSFEDPVVPVGSDCGGLLNCFGYHNAAPGNDNIGGWLLLPGVSGVDGGGHAIPGSPSAVMVLGNNYIETDNNSHLTLNFHPEDGLQSLDLTGEGNQGMLNGVKQIVATTPGSEYLLTFWLGHQYSFAQGYAGSATLGLYINGTEVQPGTFTSSQNTIEDVTWTQFTYLFTAPSPEPGVNGTVIAFQNHTDLGNNFDGLDNVSLVAVPEEASLVLLTIGTVLLTFLYRRRLSNRQF